MDKKVLRIIFATIGIVFLFAGFAGLFLPFLQGILFILIGVFILSLLSPKFKAEVYKIRSRWPKFHDKMTAIENRMEKCISKYFNSVNK